MEDNDQYESNSYLTFKIGTELFGVGVKNIINILEMTKITRVPKAPEYMKGVINLRGSILPILDTRIKFGISDTSYTTNTCILVLEVMVKSESLRLGVIVDSVQEVLDITEEEIQPPPSIGTNYQSEIITGMAKKDEEFIMLLDTTKIFTEEAIVDLKDVALNE